MLRHRLSTELPARVINKWQVEGGDIAILPVGSSEALGPHLPLGARGFVAEAFSLLMAEATDGLLLPTLPLAPVLGTAGRAGTIDVAEKETNAVIRGVLDDLAKTGFRRIVVVTFLEYASYYLPQEFWEDNAVAAAGVNLNDILWDRMSASGVGQDSVVLGALRILGREDLVKKCLDAHRRWKAEGKKNAPVSEAFASLSKIGKVGVVFPKGHFPMAPSDTLDVDAGVGILKETVAAFVPSIEAMRKYNEFLVRRSSRGFLKGSWYKE